MDFNEAYKIGYNPYSFGGLTGTSRVTEGGFQPSKGKEAAYESFERELSPEVGGIASEVGNLFDSNKLNKVSTPSDFNSKLSEATGGYDPQEDSFGELIASWFRKD